MKNKFYFSAYLFSALIFTSCEKGNDNELKTPDYSALLSDYSNTTVIATYKDMKDNAKLLYDHVVISRQQKARQTLMRHVKVGKIRVPRGSRVKHFSLARLPVITWIHY